MRMIFKKKLEEYKKQYENNLKLFEETKKKILNENEKKQKLFPHTYILYDDAGMVKPTFVSKLQQYVNIFSQFTIFSAKNNQDSKNFIERNKKFLFKLRRNYTGEKEFSLSLRKLDGTPAKFFSNEISISFIIRSEKNSQKRKMYDILPIEDTFLVLGIQDLRQLSTLNPIFLDFSNSPTFDNFVIKYSPKKHFYRFRLLTVTLSSKIMHVDNRDIVVSCVGLNDCKKTNNNGKRTDVLGIIYTENTANWNQLKSTSSWVNIDVTDYSKMQGAGNISFSFIIESIHDIAEFDVAFLNGRGEHIKFLEGEQKMQQINFVIDAINGKN